MANDSRFKFMVVIGATSATVAALLLGQIHLADVIANEVAFCHRSATPSGLLAWHFGFAWPWLALLVFQVFGLHTSRFFWLSVVAGGFTVLYAVNLFEIIFVGGETIPKWECTDWSWYDETFLDRAFAWFVVVPLLFLICPDQPRWALALVRDPDNWGPASRASSSDRLGSSKLARLVDHDAHCDTGKKPAGQ